MSEKGNKGIDFGELFLAIGAVWLGFRGIDPIQVGARAGRAAQGVRTMLQRIEDLAETEVRRVLECRAPLPCDCLRCSTPDDDDDERKRPTC